MKINCPACGHSIDLSDAYDDYDGPVRCWVCRAAFRMRAQEGCIKMIREREPATSRSSPEALPDVTNHEAPCKR